MGKVKLLKIGTLILSGVLLVALAHWGYYYWNFQRVNNISIVAVENLKCELNLPVVATSAPCPTKNGVLLHAPLNWTYVFYPQALPQESEIFVKRLACGGLVVYQARYRISDRRVATNLKQLIKILEVTPNPISPNTGSRDKDSITGMTLLNNPD